MRTERTVAFLIGLIGALLLSWCAATAFLATTTPEPPAVVVAAPADTPIHAELSEEYLNRSFMQTLASFSAPLTITGGQLDVLPGNRIAFATYLDSPLGPLTASGFVTLSVQDGLLSIHIESLTVGQLPATQLLRLFQPNLEDELDAAANRALLQRAGQAGLRLQGLTTDDASLHAYLAAAD